MHFGMWLTTISNGSKLIGEKEETWKALSREEAQCDALVVRAMLGVTGAIAPGAQTSSRSRLAEQGRAENAVRPRTLGVRNVRVAEPGRCTVKEGKGGFRFTATNAEANWKTGSPSNPTVRPDYFSGRAFFFGKIPTLVCFDVFC